MNPRRKSSQLLEIAALIMIAVSLTLYFRAAIFGFVADSEIWTITLSQLLPNVGNEISIYYKIVFHAFIKTVDLFADTNIESYVYTRLLFALVGTVTLYLTYKICYEVSRCKMTSYFAVIILLCSTLFMVRGFRIRSDILAGMIHLLNVYFVFHIFRKPKISILRDSLIHGTLFALMMLATPKAIYFAIAQVVLLLGLSNCLGGQKKSDFIKLSFFSIIGIPLTALSLSFLGEIVYAIGIITSPPSFIYYKAYEFFERTFNPAFGSPSYFSWLSLTYLRLFVKRNPLLIVLIYLGFYFPFVKILLRKAPIVPKSVKMVFFYYSLVIALATLLHNDKLPFFICSMLPPMVITGALSIGHISRVLSSFIKKNNTFVFYSFKTNIFVICSLIVSFNTYSYLKKINAGSNELQFVTVRYLEDYIKASGNPTYYDVIGTLPKQNSIYAFVGPGETASLFWVKHKLVKQSPSLIFYSSKMNFLEPFLTARFLNFSAPLGHGVFGYSPIYQKTSDTELFPNTKVVDGEVYRVFELSKLKPILENFYPDQLLRENSLSIFKSAKARHPAIHQEYPIYVQWKNGITEVFNPYTKYSTLEEQAESILIFDNYKINYFSLYPIVDFPFRDPPYFMNLFRFDINI